jgi:hypothetical protein
MWYLTTLSNCKDYIELNGRMFIYDEFKRMWKEELLKEFSQGTEESHENFSQDSQSVGEDSNPRPSEYEAAVPTT